MHRVLPILFGSLFTIAVCVAAGLLLLRALRLSFERIETAVFAFLSGAACVSVAVFGLCVVHQARAPVFLAGGLALILAASLLRPREYQTLKPFPRSVWLYAALLAVCGTIYLFHALAPEVSPDGAGYHLGNVMRYAEHHGFVWDYLSIYSALSQGLEMLFLVSYTFGGMPAAAVTHLAFFCALALLLAAYGRRFGQPEAGLFAAVLVFACPVLGLVGSSAYNDLALATCIFAGFYLLQVYDDNRKSNLLILIGLLAGFAYGIKYTGWLALPFALALLRGRGLSRILPAAAVAAMPWLIRNGLWLGNPFAPFLNRWFPNRLYTAALEASYLADLRHVEGFRHVWEIPLDLTVFGARLPGFLGPLFLLAPIALLALRIPRGGRLIAAALVFACPVLLNPAARFLAPALPFVALAMGLAMRSVPGLLPLLAVLHTILSLPPVMPLYSATYAWRLREIPVRVALGRRPEAAYIQANVGDYWLKPILEEYTSKSQKIYSISTRAEAYLDRWIIVSYESTEGNRILNALDRKEPAGALKASGIGFLLINDGDVLGDLIKQNMTKLGLSVVVEQNGTRLYRIE